MPSFRQNGSARCKGWHAPRSDSAVRQPQYGSGPGSAITRCGSIWSGDLSKGRLTGDGQVMLLSYEVTDANGRRNPAPGIKEDVLIHVRVDAKNRIAKPACGISIVNELGVLMTCVNTGQLGVTQAELPHSEKG